MKFTIKKGSRIEINVKRSSQQSALSTQHSKGIIRARREPDYLPRRIRKSDGIIYDLGQYLLEGNFTDRYIEADLDTPQSTILGFLNSPLENDLSEWTEIYKQIAPADLSKYQIVVKKNDGDFQKLGSSGLRLTESVTRLAVQSLSSGDGYVFYEKSGLFASFDTGSSDIKVTGEPDAGSDEIDFELAANVPVMMFLNLTVFTVEGNDVAYYDETSEIAERIVPRSEGAWYDVFSDPTEETSAYEPANEVRTDFTLNAEVDTLETKIINWKRSLVLPLYNVEETEDESDAKAGTVLIGDDAADAEKTVSTNSARTRYEVFHTFVNGPELYPRWLNQGGAGWRGFENPMPTVDIDTSEVNEEVTPLTEWETNLSFTNKDAFGGILKAVIVQGESVFYIWSKDAGGGGQ